MIGNYLSTLLVCVFAYLYPLFLCFKVKRFFIFPFFSKVFPFSFFPRGEEAGARMYDADFFFSNKHTHNRR